MKIQLEVFKNLVVDVRSVSMTKDGKIVRDRHAGILKNRLAIALDGEVIGLNFGIENAFVGSLKISISLIESELNSGTIKLIRIVLSKKSNGTKWRQIFADAEVLKTATMLWAKKAQDEIAWSDVKDIVELNVSRSSFQRIRKENKKLASAPKTTTTSETRYLKCGSINAKNYRSGKPKKRKVRTHNANQKELF